MTVRPSTPEARRPLGAVCRHCGSTDTWIEERWETDPPASAALAGVQMKTTARLWPYAVCDGCGHVSRGTVDHALT